MCETLHTALLPPALDCLANFGADGPNLAGPSEHGYQIRRAECR
jgi:hypothetical protein